MSKVEEILKIINIEEATSDDEVSNLMKKKLGSSGGITIDQLITELSKVKNRKSIAYISSLKFSGLKRVVGVFPGGDKGEIPLIIMEGK